MVGHLAFHYIVEREHMIVFHLEMTAVVIKGSATVPVVRGVNVKPPVKHPCGRIGHVVVGI